MEDRVANARALQSMCDESLYTRTEDVARFIIDSCKDNSGCVLIDLAASNDSSPVKLQEGEEDEEEQGARAATEGEEQEQEDQGPERQGEELQELKMKRKMMSFEGSSSCYDGRGIGRHEEEEEEVDSIQDELKSPAPPTKKKVMNAQAKSACKREWEVDPKEVSWWMQEAKARGWPVSGTDPSGPNV